MRAFLKLSNTASIQPGSLCLGHYPYQLCNVKLELINMSELYSDKSRTVFFLACLAGQYGDGVTCTNCPDDSFSPTWNSTIDETGDCIDCPEGHNTNGDTGQTSCTYCDDGFYGNGM